MNPLQQLNMADIQQALLKAMETGNVTPLIKEDLEVEAHNQLYEETSEVELTLLKDIARRKAEQIKHEFSVVKSYGNERTSPYIPETGLPTYQAGVFERRTVDIKLVAEYASVTLLAALQAAIQARGTSDQAELEAKNKRSLLMHKLNRELYFADPETTRSTLRMRGIYRILQDYVSAGTGHVIDLRGAKLSQDKIREGARVVSEYHGSMRAIYMSPLDKTNLESVMDAAERTLPAIQAQQNATLIRGSVIDGMLTQAGSVFFRVDNTLTPRHALQTPPDNDNDIFASGVPSALGTISTVVLGATAGSKWAAGDVATDWIYRVTALNEVGEGQYAQSAVIGAGLDAGDAVDVSWTQRATDFSYRVYRGSATETAGKFGLIAEVKADGNSSTKTFTDKDLIMPGTRYAFGFNISSSNFRKPQFPQLGNPALPGNTLSMVELAPMSVFELAKLFLVASNDIIFQPVCTEVSHPFQNIIFINVGDA